ncbi:MAG: hypothetical protein ACRDL6_12735 [Solirubrobacterales bacterium]
MAALAKLNTGERTLGGGAIVLLASLWLPWFGTAEEESPFIPPARKVTINAWESFDLSDLFLCLLGLAALTVLVAALRGVDIPRPGAPLVLLGTSLVAAGIILARIEDPLQNTSTRIGLWIGLLAVIAIAVGAWLSLDAARAPGPAAAGD